MIKLTNLLPEGVYDKKILKCIFTAGGPGSGKSYVVNDIFFLPKNSTLTGSGLKVVNRDFAFTKLLQKNGINPKDLAKINDENPHFYSTVIDGNIRSKAIRLTDKIREYYSLNRMGMIIDGTGSDSTYIASKKKELEEWGYDTAMIFVNTSLNMVMKRNSERDRTLPNTLIANLWKVSQNNIETYRRMFGDNFYLVDNTEAKSTDSSIKKAINDFIDNPIKNPIGKNWIRQAMLMRKYKQ